MESNFDKLAAVTDKFKLLADQQRATIDELLLDKINLIQENIDLKRNRIKLLEEKKQGLSVLSENKTSIHSKVETLINRTKTRITQLKEYKQEYVKEERWMEVAHNQNRILILEMMLQELEDLLK